MKKTFLKGLLAVFMLVCLLSSACAEGSYKRIKGNYYYYWLNDECCMVESVYDTPALFKTKMKDRVDSYNQHLSGDDYEVYFYFVNNCRNTDLTGPMEGVNPDYLFMMEQLPCVDHYACLTLDSPETYMRYFYQTDHHWNHIGAQKGYEDIISLLTDGTETPYQPDREVVYDVNFRGSYFRQTEDPKAPAEPFRVYKYTLPETVTLVDGKKKTIGREKQYDEGTISKGKFVSHYMVYYGGDFGEIVYDTGRPEKENLLILCNSYGTMVRQLIAAHFNKTYVVDTREYKNQTGHSLKIEQYIEEHEIDKVLILGDVSYFLHGSVLE